jgi:hypothetical protein
MSRLEFESYARNAESLLWRRGVNQTNFDDPFVQSFNQFSTILDQPLVDVKIPHDGADAALFQTQLVGWYTAFSL